MLAFSPCRNGYGVIDLQSTNGTFVNDGRITLHQLKDGDYLRIGNGIYRFLAGGNVEAEYHEEIYRLTIVDALTEIHNKRYFLDFLEPAAVALDALSPAAGPGDDRHGQFQVDQRRDGPPRRRPHAARDVRPRSRRWSARTICSPVTAVRNSPW